mgnify:CR=1 FL=1
MLLNKFFKMLVILSLCLVSAISCAKEDNNTGETTKPSDCKPGDDFFTYANAQWLESLGTVSSKQWQGYLFDIDRAAEAKVDAVKESMSEIKALKQAGANIKKKENRYGSVSL